MAREFKLTGENNEEKLACVEGILKRLVTRDKPVSALTIVPFVPICMYCAKPDITGIIGNAMIAQEGDIVGIAVYAEKIVERVSPALTVIFTDILGASVSISIPYKDKFQYFERQTPLVVGTRISVSTTAFDSVEGLWVTLILAPTVKRGTKEELLTEITKEINDTPTE